MGGGLRDTEQLAQVGGAQERREGLESPLQVAPQLVSPAHTRPVADTPRCTSRARRETGLCGAPRREVAPAPIELESLPFRPDGYPSKRRPDFFSRREFPRGIRWPEWARYPPGLRSLPSRIEGAQRMVRRRPVLRPPEPTEGCRGDSEDGSKVAGPVAPDTAGSGTPRSARRSGPRSAPRRPGRARSAPSLPNRRPRRATGRAAA